VAPAAALAATSAGAGAARAAVPAGLVKLTVLYAATASAAPISVSVITEGVIISMFVAKLKVAVAATAVVAVLTASAVVLAQSGMGGSKDDTGKRDRGQPKIVLTSPELRDVAIIQQYVGRVHVQHVNVCTSQKGYLAEIKVSEGQAVKKGDLMFEVRSILNQAKTDAASTDIVAPFDGIVELPRYQPGSLLRAGEILTTLSNNKKIWVDFNVPEKQYLEYQANPREYDGDKIDLVLANGAKFPHLGKLGAIEAQFNANTGNITFRADFPNPDGLLRQGQSGIIELHRTLRDALVIPRRATFENLGKRYVYVVGKDDAVHRREIDIQYELDDIYIVSKGVDVGERIVLDGIRKVNEGEKLKSELRSPEEAIRKLKTRDE
jgi:membrane fusion protein (multidrug efflux system)